MYLGYFLIFLAISWLFGVLFFKVPRNLFLVSFLGIWIGILGFVVSKIGLISLVYVLSVLLVLFCFCLSFYADRVYNYLFAIIFLTIVPFLLILKLDEIAEVLAAIAFLFLVLGFIKDAFYEKFIKN